MSKLFGKKIPISVKDPLLQEASLAGLHSAPVPVHSSFTSGDLVLGWGLRTDGLAHIWRERARSRRAAHLVLRGWPLTWSFFAFLGEFEKDSAECLKHLELLEGEEGQNLNKGDSEEEVEYPDPLLLRGLIPEKAFASFDLRFLQEFIFKLLQSE